MSTTTTHRVELPTGYSVVDRLGAGGYGEVWKATAPGGLEKAVKIVFGHCDEGMAERELKSLERIKSVRHPFLLSIERYEIVNNRLVIVTELADMSLSDCFQNHVAAGDTGIPRDQLIAYLWDAAEALDCLLEQHSLQHLDIKPENLLVVGDHIKVADFGLVKELASKTLNSMMGGMTPLYSAPEIYDNNPSARSDQYSLAIVYQHMLTGTLPFSGRTPAQLAKQHTLAQPNLNPLSEADRRAVKRALEKNPQERFASCREFVSALRSGSQPRPLGVATAPDARHAPPTNPIAGDDTKSISLIDTKHLRDPISAAATQVLSELEGALDEVAELAGGQQPTPQCLPQFPVVDAHIVDVETPDFDRSQSPTAAPTLFVGIGGIGIKLLKAIRQRASAHDPQNQLALAWLAIDADRETLKGTCDASACADLSADDKLHVPLRRPNQYRDDSQALLQWVSRRWLYNIPRSLQTRGFRPLGRIAIVDHAAEVLAALQKRLQSLAARHQATDGPQPAVRVVVLAGMSGGTGGGTVIDIAQAVRSLCREHSQEVLVHGVLGCTYHPDSNDSLAAANMHSLLMELTHAQSRGNCGESSPPGPAALYEAPRRPFDELYAVSIPFRGGRADADLTLRSVADYLLLDASGTTRPAMDAIRAATASDVERCLLRTFGCTNVGQLASEFTAHREHELLKGFVEYWLKPGPATNDPDARFFQTQANSQFARAALAYFAECRSDSNTPINEAAAAEERSRRSGRIKCVATGFLQFLDSIQLHVDSEQSPLEFAGVAAACERIAADACQLVERGNLSEDELGQHLADMVAGQVQDLAAAASGNDSTTLATSALALFAGGPLNCGYQRRTLLVSPHEHSDPSLAQAYRDTCPTLTHYLTMVNETYLIREGSGLNPVHLGARLAELYPDIDEAAHRLHSRDDIKWQDLRTASPELVSAACN